MRIGTNLWNFGWGNGRVDYFVDGIDWSTVENPWRERFLEEMSIYSVIRFMDQAPTNNSTVRYWHERVPKDANHYETPGGAVAYEWQIDLANRLGADLWITVPHLTIENYEENPEENYWTELARLIKAELDPGLNVYVEYSNETWNRMFSQAVYAAERGVAMGFAPDGYTASFWFHTYAALRLHDVFLKVFADQPERVKTVVASQSHWGTQQILKALEDPLVNPWGRTPEYLAIGGYFSPGGDGGAPNVRELWTEALANLPNSEYPKHLQSAQEAGMKLIIYEGGQHYTTNAHLFSQNPESYDMYMEWLNAMQEYVELLLHYTHVGAWRSGGAWGARLDGSAGRRGAPLPGAAGLGVGGQCDGIAVMGDRASVRITGAGDLAQKADALTTIIRQWITYV